MSNTGTVGDQQLTSTLFDTTSPTVGRSFAFIAARRDVVPPTADIAGDVYERALQRVSQPGETVSVETVIEQLDVTIASTE